jgi:hypothetical protein
MRGHEYAMASALGRAHPIVLILLVSVTETDGLLLSVVGVVHARVTIEGD